MPFTVKEIQPTPNPNAAKFVLDQAISDQPVSFLSPQQGANHPIASELFSVKGVTSVLILSDFITINKTPGANWNSITPQIKEILQKCS